MFLAGTFFVGEVRKTTASCGVRNFRDFRTHATRASNSSGEKKLEPKNQLLGIKLLLTVYLQYFFTTILFD